jgi:hypothetical protein
MATVFLIVSIIGLIYFIYLRVKFGDAPIFRKIIFITFIGGVLDVGLILYSKMGFDFEVIVLLLVFVVYALNIKIEELKNKITLLKHSSVILILFIVLLSKIVDGFYLSKFMPVGLLIVWAILFFVEAYQKNK